MKKSKLTIGLGLASLFVLSGCGDSPDNDQHTGILDTTPTRLNAPSRYYDEDYRGANNDSYNFGYTRMNSGTGENADRAEAPTIDREQLADIISRLSNQIPDVNDVSTLVTDEEVLIVYDSDTNNRNATADQVKRTALSIVPRYFHVYGSVITKHSDRTLKTLRPRIQTALAWKIPLIQPSVKCLNLLRETR